MSGMDTRSMSRLIGITSLNDPGTHQDVSEAMEVWAIRRVHVHCLLERQRAV